jgi:Leucine-rich repeat (LRR) protein
MNLVHLEFIDMSHNFIENLIDDIFVNFTSLKVVNFNQNRVTKLENSMFPANNKIMKLQFSQNLLSSIEPEIIKNLKQIKLIDLTGNKCIDTKYDENYNNVKKVMEIFGEIHFKCMI